MKRFIFSDLIAWKDSPSRVPLILRGARQTGKSFIVEKFGKENFEFFVELNLEFQQELHACFSTLKPEEILLKIEAMMGVEVHPGKTLLFIDEIQYCKEAILALRYFKEKLPELHVMAAGSLLEFALQEEEFSFPVGRVQFIYMYPCSFWEVLHAKKQTRLISLLEETEPSNQLPEELHQLLIKQVREYFFVGGMPEAMQAYIDRMSFSECEMLQNKILTTYRSDFGKYARKAQFKYLQRLFDRAPLTVGSHFTYASIHPDMRARELKVALEQLSWAGLLYPVTLTRATGIPLHAQSDPDRFKLVFLDIGLLQRTTQIQPKEILESDLTQINAGALAEQFVGQELRAYNTAYVEKNLYYWEGETRGSTAEVDFVVNINSMVVPIEVKAGKTGRLRSLQRFMELKNSPLGVRISERPLSLDRKILSVPFYLIKELPRLIQTCLAFNENVGA